MREIFFLLAEYIAAPWGLLILVKLSSREHNHSNETEDYGIYEHTLEYMLLATIGMLQYALRVNSLEYLEPVGSPRHLTILLSLAILELLVLMAIYFSNAKWKQTRKSTFNKMDAVRYYMIPFVCAVIFQIILLYAILWVNLGHLPVRVHISVLIFLVILAIYLFFRFRFLDLMQIKASHYVNYADVHYRRAIILYKIIILLSFNKTQKINALWGLEHCYIKLKDKEALRCLYTQWLGYKFGGDMDSMIKKSLDAL